MRIVKHCNREHNPTLASKTIQMGTPRFFTRLDSDFVRDVNEGEATRVFSPAGIVTVSGDELGALTGMSISGTGQIAFSGNAMATSAALPDAYIFCTSLMDVPKVGLGYNSLYVIRDPDLFCEKVAREVSRILGGADVFGCHRAVVYSDDKRVVFRELASFVYAHRSVDVSAYFVKRRTSSEDPSRCYEGDREYRFVFVPIGRPTVLGTLSETIAIEAKVVSGLLDTA